MGSHKKIEREGNKKLNSQKDFKRINKKAKEQVESKIKESIKLKVKNGTNKKNIKYISQNFGTYTKTPIHSHNKSNNMKLRDKSLKKSEKQRILSNTLSVSFEDIERKIFENCNEESSTKIKGIPKKIAKKDKIISTEFCKENQNHILTLRKKKSNKNINELSDEKCILSKELINGTVKNRERKEINKHRSKNRKLKNKKTINNYDTEKIDKVNKEKLSTKNGRNKDIKMNKNLLTKPKVGDLLEIKNINNNLHIENEPSTSKEKCGYKKSNNLESNIKQFTELDQILNAKTNEKETVQIELESTNVMWGMTKRKKKSHQELIQDYLRKRVNRHIKEVQENMHKMHLLCLIAHGRYINTMINSEEIMQAAISITSKKIYPDKRLNIGHLEIIIKWYKKMINLTDQSTRIPVSELLLKEVLLKRFQNQKAHSKEEFTLMFLAFLRILGVNGRLIYNLIPISWKISTNLLIKPKKLIEQSKDEYNIAKNYLVGGKKTARKESINEEVSSDSDFSQDVEQYISVTKSKKSKKSVSRKENNKLLSYWIEVYVEEEEEWISIDVTAGEIHHSSEQFQNKLPSMCGYILAFNSDLTIKDVTKRYIQNWLSCKDKVRLDHSWWEESVLPFRGFITKKDVEEDENLNNILEKQPLPKTMSNYKNHPLYVLQRHLLKFEALYPPGVSPIGYFRGEPVFSRECVRQLHGREKWIKEAMTVKVDEEPYKIVKARPKWDKVKCQIIKDLPLDLFGEWQVEDYVPPVAKNGKVPRNEYGNVELFKPSMLPKGCVHINIGGGLNKVARILGIDCSPAITGFDFHGGWTHPVFEGFVVCEEFKDILMDAWHQEQEEAAKREEDKRLRNIYGNWRKLVNGLIVKERIKEKYGDIIQNERKDIKKKPQRKLKLDTSRSVAKRKAPNLSIDFESSAANRKRSVKELVKNELAESSEEEATAEEKQEKIRTILNWNPSQSQNPDLSDSDEEMIATSNIQDTACIKRSKRKSANCNEPPLSEGSTSQSDNDFDVQPKKRSKRSRSKVTYKRDSDSEVIFTDSDNDKTFKPVK